MPGLTPTLALTDRSLAGAWCSSHYDQMMKTTGGRLGLVGKCLFVCLFVDTCCFILLFMRDTANSVNSPFTFVIKYKQLLVCVICRLNRQFEPDHGRAGLWRKL